MLKVQIIEATEFSGRLERMAKGGQSMTLSQWSFSVTHCRNLLPDRVGVSILIALGSQVEAGPRE